MRLLNTCTVGWVTAVLAIFCRFPAAAELSPVDSPSAADFILFADGKIVPIIVERSEDRAVQRAVVDLAEDLRRVSSVKPEASANETRSIIIGTLGKSKTIDRLAAEGKLQTNGVSGQWESWVLQIVRNPTPGVDQALVIAGSDRRGTIY